jgi:hypothetical protein
MDFFLYISCSLFLVSFAHTKSDVLYMRSHTRLWTCFSAWKAGTSSRCIWAIRWEGLAKRRNFGAFVPHHRLINADEDSLMLDKIWCFWLMAERSASYRCSCILTQRIPIPMVTRQILLNSWETRACSHNTSLTRGTTMQSAITTYRVRSWSFA